MTFKVPSDPVLSMLDRQVMLTTPPNVAPLVSSRRVMSMSRIVAAFDTVPLAMSMTLKVATFGVRFTSDVNDTHGSYHWHRMDGLR